jgi:GDPmannose 4,6-dehydratase
MYRRLSTPNFWRLQELGVIDKIKLIPADLIDFSSILEAIKISQPDEIYNLAAQSFVGASFEQPVGAGLVTGLGVTNILEAIRLASPEAHFYQASTSELYGNSSSGMLNEKSPFMPASPYAVAKLYGYWITRVYRKAYGLFACNGILFNHESPLRGLEFVTRKISSTIAKIKFGMETELILGNLKAKRDWGYAPEYVESMWLMLQADSPEDYVIATGNTHSVAEFAELAFSYIGLDWTKFTKSECRFRRPLDVECLIGDYSKAKKELNWEPKTDFRTLVLNMVDADLCRCKAYNGGKMSYWDAASYPGSANIITRNM